MATKLTTLPDEVIYVDYTTAKEKAVEEDKSRESRCPFEDNTELRVVWTTDKENKKVPTLLLQSYTLDGVEAEHQLPSIRLTDGKIEWDASLSLFKSYRGLDENDHEVVLEGLCPLYRDTNKLLLPVVSALEAAKAFEKEEIRFVLHRTFILRIDKEGRRYRSSAITISLKA